MALQLFNRAYDPQFQQLESMALSEPSHLMIKNPVQISEDWRETPHAHIFQADLPGVKKASSHSSKSQLLQQFRDDGINIIHLSDEVKASVSHGVLTVNIPKKHAKNLHVKKVEIEDVNKEGIGHKIVKSLKGILAPAKSK